MEADGASTLCHSVPAQRLLAGSPALTPSAFAASEPSGADRVYKSTQECQGPEISKLIAFEALDSHGLQQQC